MPPPSAPLAVGLGALRTSVGDPVQFRPFWAYALPPSPRTSFMDAPYKPIALVLKRPISQTIK